MKRLGEAVLVSVLFALLLLYCARRIWDIDVFWHIAIGRVFLEQGRIVEQDTLSAIDPTAPWTSIQWGYEVIVALLDRAGGLGLVRFAHGAIQFLAFVLFYVIARRRLGLGVFGSAAALSLLALLYADRFRERPHVFNLLFEVLLLPWLVEGTRHFTRRRGVVLALVMLVWANIHGGGALTFLIILASYPAASLLLPGTRKKAFSFFASAAVPALVSPYFILGLLTQMRMVGATEEYTYEWHPSWRYLLVGSIPAHFFAGLFPSLLVLLWALCAARLLRSAIEGGRSAFLAAAEKIPLENLAASFAILAVCHRSLRFVYMAAFALLILRPCVETVLGLQAISARTKNAVLALAIAVCTVFTYQSRVLFLYGSLKSALTEVTGRSPLQEAHYPIGAADFLEQTGFEGNVFAQAKIGGYLLYRLFPRVRVLADGRGNYSEEVTRDLRRVGSSENFKDPALGPKIQEIYERYPIDAVVTMELVWPPGYVPPSGWVAMFADDRSKVWVRCTPRGRAYLARVMGATPAACGSE